MAEQHGTPAQEKKTPAAPEPLTERWMARLSLPDIVLGSILMLTLTVGGLGLVFYLLPPAHLELPELQPALRVGRIAEFPVGAARITTWGENIILVVRPTETDYVALEGISTLDGCILEWDVDSRRVFSPCGYMEFDLNGRVVRGLTTEPLKRYSVFIRDSYIYVAS